MQQWRGDTAAVQERHLPPGPAAPGAGVRAGVDRQPEAGDAQGPAVAAAAAVHGQLRRAAAAAGRRGQGRLPGAQPAGAAGTGTGGRTRMNSLLIPVSADLATRSVGQQSSLLFAGIGAVLGLATLVAEMLSWRQRRRGQPSAVIANLVSRIRAWWVMVIVVGLALLFGRAGVIVLFALISLLALREFITLAPTRSGDYYALLAAFYLVLPWQYYLVWIDWYGLYTLLIPVYAFLFLPILATIGGDTTHYLERTAKVQWGLMICVFCLSHVPLLLNLQVPGHDP